jgi:small subunit ribosomal protein S20
MVTKARRLMESNEVEAAEAAVKDAVVALDKAAQKGAIHHKNAARRKSRLIHQFHTTTGS